MFIKQPMFLRNADTGAGGAAGGAGAGGAGGGEKPWFDSFDAETKGYLTTRTWDKKTPAEAFLEASKAHREAEKFVGAPSDKLIRIPDERPTDTPETRQRHAQEWEGIRKRLGKPADVKEYDFSDVKINGQPLDQEMSDWLKQTAFDSNLSKADAVKWAAAQVKRTADKDVATAALRADNLAKEKKELEKNWGTNAAANMVVAQAAIRALGVDPIVVAALETGDFKGLGYAKVMDMFREIGSKIGEDRFVNPPGGNGGGGPMTRDQAVAEKESLKKDKAWVTRYLSGGVEEKRKMDALDRIISGVK